jgi:hypothetical protein
MPNSTFGAINSTSIHIPDGTIITGSIVGGTLSLEGASTLPPNLINQITETVIFQATSISTTMQTIQQIIWQKWNESFVVSNCGSCADYTINSATLSNQAWVNWNCSHEESQARLRRQTEQSAASQAAWVVAEGEKARARERAGKLLQENLSPKQREELAAKGHFHLEVFSKDGTRRTYQINKGRSGNVKQLNEAGRIIKSLCCHPIEMVPDEDTMLAQKLFLEAREEDFLSIANHTNYG